MKNSMMKISAICTFSVVAVAAQAEADVATNTETTAQTEVKTEVRANRNAYIGVLLGKSNLDIPADLGTDTSKAFYIGAGYSNMLELRLGKINYGEFKVGSIKYEGSGFNLDALLKYKLHEKGDIYGLVGIGAMVFDTTAPQNISGKIYNIKTQDVDSSYQLGLGYRYHIGRFSLQGEIQQSRGRGDFDGIKFTTMGIGANLSF